MSIVNEALKKVTKQRKVITPRPSPDNKDLRENVTAISSATSNNKLPYGLIALISSVALIGIILAIHFSLWITSIKLTSIASSVILVASHPIIVGPISHFFLKEKLTKFNVLGIIIGFIGVIILVYGNYGLTSISIDSMEGNLLALLGGIAAGFYILGQ